MSSLQASPRSPTAEPAPPAPLSDKPQEQAPPPPEQAAPSYPAPVPPAADTETDDIWKLAASLGAEDDPAANDASGLEILDALAELRENFCEPDDDAATKNALEEIQQASSEAASTLPILADFVTEELLVPPKEDTEPAPSSSSSAASSSSKEDAKPEGQELTAALLSAAVDESAEATENLMAALSGISDISEIDTVADESVDNTADLMAALSQLSAVEASSQPEAASAPAEETTDDLMAALSLLGAGDEASQEAGATTTATEESTTDLLAALAGLGGEAPEETTDDLMRSLGELSASAGEADEVEAVESVEDLMASLQAAESNEPAIEVDDGATTEDLMATLDALSGAAGSSPSEPPKKLKTVKGLVSMKQDTFLSTTWESSEGGDPAVEIPEEFAAAFAKHTENKGRKKVDVGRIGRGGRGRTKKANKPDPTQFAPMTSIEDSQWMVSPSVPSVLKQAAAAAAPARTNNPAWMQSLFGGPDVAPPEEEELPPLDTDDTVPSASAASLAAGSLLRDWSIKEDMNRPGLRRSKKRPIKGNKHGKKPLQMEDFNFCSFPWLGDVTQGMFCVFDGHVDKDCGQALVTAWPMTWKKLTTGVDMTQVTDLTDILVKAFLTVDNELKEYEYCGSTMTVVLIWEGPNRQRYLQAANVGDSLAFLCRGNIAVDLSEVHCVREPSEAQRLRDAGSTVNEGATRINGLSVSRAIGDHFVKEVTPGFTAQPFVSPSYALGPEDTHLVVASDGLWDVITGQQAIDEVQKHTSALRMSSALLQTALASKKCNDNVTVCAIVL